MNTQDAICQKVRPGRPTEDELTSEGILEQCQQIQDIAKKATALLDVRSRGFVSSRSKLIGIAQLARSCFNFNETVLMSWAETNSWVRRMELRVASTHDDSRNVVPTKLCVEILLMKNSRNELWYPIT